VTRAKAQNRNSISHKPDQSLPRKKILRGKRNFQRLFQRSTVLKHSPLLCRYRVYPDPDSNCLFGFIAPKNLFRRAVDRNRAKRLLRESFRLNQQLLPAAIRNNEIVFHAVFIATGKTLSYSKVEQSMISLLKLISDRFTSDSISDADNNHFKKD
jgi:ribonuclease P protein component